MIIQADERIEGRLYHQTPEGFIELSPEAVIEFNARLAAHEAAQLEQQPTE